MNMNVDMDTDPCHCTAINLVMVLGGSSGWDLTIAPDVGAGNS